MTNQKYGQTENSLKYQHYCWFKKTKFELKLKIVEGTKKDGLPVKSYFVALKTTMKKGGYTRLVDEWLKSKEVDRGS